MMTSKNSKFARTKMFFTIPVLAIAGFIFAQKTAKTDSNETKTKKKNNIVALHVSDDPIIEYNQIIKKYGNLLEQKKYGEFHKKVSLSDRSKLHDLYFQLTNEQRAATPLFFMNTPKKLAKTKVTQIEISDFMNSKKYGLWIDGKKTKNQELKNFKPEDFSNHFISKRYPNAISKQNPEPFQLNMMTNKYYNEYLKEEDAVHMSFKIKAFIKGKDTIHVKRNTDAVVTKGQDIAYGEAADLIPAEYPGGSSELRKKIINVFDSSSFESTNGIIKSDAFLTVDVNGKAINIEAVGNNEKFNKEVSRAVQLANENITWKVAIKNGKPERFRYKIPLAMQFESPKKTQKL